MLSIALHDNVVFHDKDPNAEPLFVDKTGRILRFSLKAGQSVQEHVSPHSPVYIVVLEGVGVFSGGDKQEQRSGPGTLFVIAAGEAHAIRAEDEELVFLAFLHGVPGAR
ncbi:MAG: cupin domain-containing protein [Ardenticatenales bacterium]|nr:cupin domain-containing protein [Ardenticatenales bacterium]